MNAELTYGGWVAERPVETGGISNLVRFVGGMAAAVGIVLASVGTGGELSLERLQQGVWYMQHVPAVVEIAEVELIRTPSENLKRIREVLNPAVSDLATTFRVSRQSVYNWLNGEQVAEGNSAKLQDLAKAADVLAHEGITVNAALLKRRFTNGMTLLQVSHAGGSAHAAALLLVQICKRERAQRERVIARFANREKTPETADFDLPASNDHI